MQATQPLEIDAGMPPARGMQLLTRPHWLSQAQAAIVLFAAVIAVGVVDAVTGIHYSFAIFYLVPVLYSVVWLGRLAAIGMALASVVVRLVGDSISLGVHTLPMHIWWNALTAALVFCLIVWLFADLLALYRQLEKHVEDRTAELVDSAHRQKELEHELLLISSRERTAFGQELHDDICQHLVGTAMAAKVLAHRLERKDAGASQDALAIVGWIEQGASKARELARGLLLSSIDPESLPEKLEELAEEGSRAGVRCRFQHEGDTLLPDAGTAAQIYRIAQEAMRNALRHGNPTGVDILLMGNAEGICLTVLDDGSGINTENAEHQKGIGLRIMALRAESIGATLTFPPPSGSGTSVVCYLPRRSSP